MKAAVNKITEQAKHRDTIGRNKVLVLNTTDQTLIDLYSLQQTVSSDNVEKMTHVILRSENGASFLLKFRMLELTASIEVPKFKMVQVEEQQEVNDCDSK